MSFDNIIVDEEPENPEFILEKDAMCLEEFVESLLNYLASNGYINTLKIKE